MADSDGGGLGHPCVAEVKKMLSDELAAILDTHHASLREQFSLWMDQKEGAIEDIARQFDHGHGAPREGGPSDGQVAAATALATSPENVFHGFKVTPPRARLSRRITASSSTEARSVRGSIASTPSAHPSRSSTYSNFLSISRKEAAVAAFAQNSAAMRKRQAPLYLEEPGACSQRRVRRLMQSTSCNAFICTVILTYIITMGFEVEVDAADRTSSSALLYIQSACNIVFLAELLVRIYAEGERFVCGEDRFYNILDTMLVILSIFDMATQVANTDANGGSLGKMMVLRVLRVVRIIRVVRVMRVLKFVRPLRVLVYSICATMKPLAYAIVLLATIMYTFAVVFTEAARGTQSEHMAQYFGSLLRSVLTLFKSVSNGVSWELAFHPLNDVHWLYGALFVLYVVFAQLAVLNVMTGQFCSSAIESSSRDDDDMISEHLANKSFYVKKLKAVFSDIAGDDEILTVDTFERTMSDEHMQAFFQSLGIKVSDAFTLFTLLDQGEEHCIDLGRFVEGCLNLRGNASAIGLGNLAHEIRWLTQHLNKHLVEIRDLVAPGSHGTRDTASVKFADDFPPSSAASASLADGAPPIFDSTHRV